MESLDPGSGFAKQHQEEFDEEDYFVRQQEQNELRQEKIKQLFPSPSHPVLLEWKDLNMTVSTKGFRLFNRKKKEKENGKEKENKEKKTGAKTKTMEEVEAEEEEEEEDDTSKRSILKNLSGSVAPGEFLAILGPSGAGKTSLLHALAGRIPRQRKEEKRNQKNKEEVLGLTGEIQVNRVDRDSTPVDQESCFVLQDDIFFGELTVKQTLRFTARLSMPQEVPTKEKDARAEDLISLLRLRKCKNTCVGSIFRRGISGGEKKRLNIANELMNNPTLVMMDEPTSGLDASTALLVVSLLSDLAKSGKTVIATLHQPSSLMFHMFDKLLLLADGQTAYLGSAKNALPYFSSLGFHCPDQFNPADYVLHLLDEVPSSEGGGRRKEEGGGNRGRTGKGEEGRTYRTRILEAYQNSRSREESSDVDTEKSRSDEEEVPLELNMEKKKAPPALPPTLNKGFQASFWTQMRLLALRGAKQHLIEAIPNLVIFLIMSVMVSIAWWQLGYSEDDLANRTGLLFFIVWNAFMMPMFSALSELANERRVVRKERPSHLYRLSAYILSKTLANAPIDAMSPIIMSVIIYWTCNLNDKFERFVIFCILSFFGQLSGMGIGITLGVNFDKPERATPWVIVVFFLFSIMGGFFIQISALPVWFRWTQYISLIKYWMDAILVNEFDDKDHVFKLNRDDVVKGASSFITGKEYLKERELIFDSVWPPMLILVGSYVFAQVSAYFLLRWHTQKKK